MSGALCYPGGERVFQAQGIARVKPQRLTAPRTFQEQKEVHRSGEQRARSRWRKETVKDEAGG